MILTAKDLILKAQNGEKLDAESRRHAIAFLLVTQPDMGPSAMADIFGVTESLIRYDKKKLREIMVDELREESEIKYIVSDIVQDFRKVYKNVETAMSSAGAGTAEYLRYNQVLFDLRLKMVKSMQELGWLPKGEQDTTKEEYVFEVNVGNDGRITSQKVQGKVTKKGSVGLAQKKEEDVINITSEDEPIETALIEENGITKEDNA